FKTSFILAFILILLGFFLGYKIFVPTKEAAKQWNLTDNSTNGVRFISEQSLINEIRTVNKIVPLEIEFSESIIVDKSWGDFSVFEKFKKIKFFANCSYAVDLSNASSDNIKIDKLNGSVNLTLPPPEVFSIDIDEDKTVYEEVNNGLFRFGDVTLTSEEHGVIEREVSNSFEKKMKEPEIYDKAIANTTVALEKLINDITGSDLSVKITFK
ncbi:MAG: DUF4230 domain-containing protein, partial [Clostridium sp.]